MEPWLATEEEPFHRSYVFIASSCSWQRALSFSLRHEARRCHPNYFPPTLPISTPPTGAQYACRILPHSIPIGPLLHPFPFRYRCFLLCRFTQHTPSAKNPVLLTRLQLLSKRGCDLYSLQYKRGHVPIIIV